MKQNKIAVTGGIGSGKSDAMRILSEAGCAVVSADDVSRAVAKSTRILRKIKKLFGPQFVENGELKRKELAAFVFGNDGLTKKLNRIMHPAIFWKLRREIRKYKDEFVFVEVPLLIETGAQKHFDFVWLVTAPEEQRIERVMLRDGLSTEDVRKRIEKQLPDEKKASYAHTIIVNDKSGDDFKRQVLEALRKLRD